ncbi:MAG TPA: DUF2254 domain-containing protein [Fimbriimonadaceae bacterium]|nr:DUF2254 domain-containing protein [Fimbriimonadaceae bacterium]
MLKRFPLFIRHIMYNLRGGFLVRPLIITLALGFVGAMLSFLEESIPSLSAGVPRWLFPSHSDSQVAQVILGGIATSVMTVVSIVFAILLMTLTLASMQFSPRIIVSFAKDRVTQWTLGIFLGTFTYCIAALPAAHTYPQRFEPVLTVVGAMFLALMCVAWLLFFIHHISQAISVNHIVDRIAMETEEMIREMMPNPASHSRLSILEAPHARGDGTPLASDISGYVRYVDTNRLLALAKSHRFAIHVVRRVGHFVPAGVTLLTVTKAHKLTPELETELRSAFDIGPTRTLQQDVEFGILQIVDIALKAISPAVNDPTTAVSCVDQLCRILICFAGREPIEDGLYDPPGVLRVAVPWLGLERLVDSAFEQIRMYAKGDVAVSLRLLRALGDIGATVPERSTREVLAERGRRIVAGAAERVGNEEIKEMRIRLAELEKAAAEAN